MNHQHAMPGNRDEHRDRHGDHHAHHAGLPGAESEGKPAHDAHAGHSPEMFRSRFWLSAAFTVPAVLWSEHIEMLLGYRAPAVSGASWLPAVFGTLVFRVRRARFPSRGLA